LSKAKLVINSREIRLLATEKELTVLEKAATSAVPSSKKLGLQAGASN
jgi:hypothetical protein